MLSILYVFCCRDCLGHQVPLVSLGLLVPLQLVQHRVLGPLDHQERTGNPVNLYVSILLSLKTIGQITP